jgi:superfamily II DNA helicase RecQ
MNDCRCRYCRRLFQPSRFHPQQAVCSQASCQRQRLRDYRQQKIRSDPVYAQVVCESRKKWRDANSGYQKQYWSTHPQAAERNRQQQRARDQHRRLQNLVKNNLALDLKHYPAEAWLVGPAADLVKNNLARSQLLLFQPVGIPAAGGEASCKEQPSGVASCSDL